MTQNINYLPTTEEVAANIRSRTIDALGNELGTFDDNTTPDAEQAGTIIFQSANEISSIFGSNIPDAPGDNPEAYRLAGANIIGLMAAARIELSYFGKEVARQQSPYPYLIKELDRALLWLASQLGISLPGDTGAGNDNLGGSHTAIWGNDVVDRYTDMNTRPM